MALVHARREAIPGANYAAIRSLGELLPFEAGVLAQAMMNVLMAVIGTLTVTLKLHSLTSRESTLSSRVSQWRSVATASLFLRSDRGCSPERLAESQRWCSHGTGIWLFFGCKAQPVQRASDAHGLKQP